MNILVTGGAGYIGSVAVKKLVEEGHSVVVVDNLTKGRKELVDSSAKFYEVDLMDKEKLDGVFSENKFDAVMHFAGYKAAGESMTELGKYSQNIIGHINLLDCIVKFGVKKMIYSSSAAVYGEPKYNPVDEKHPTDPINYYGFTKLECERLNEWYSKQKGLAIVNLRYFNVAGDAGLKYEDPDAQNIFPLIMKVYNKEMDELKLFGDDYDTIDGTCVRDYIDINDLVDAHVLALKLDKSETINLGTSKGVSVLELIHAFEEAKGKLKYKIVGRRAGDPAKLTASYEKANQLLGWEPKKSVKDMVESVVGV